MLVLVLVAGGVGVGIDVDGVVVGGDGVIGVLVGFIVVLYSYL